MPQHKYTREEQYDMIAKLRKQVEFYFSPQNLAQDTFMQSLLEKHGENGVPVETIATFHRVKALYDVAPWLPTLLSWAMANSLVVSVSEDGKWIRPISACPIITVCPIPVSTSSVPGNTTPIPWDEEVLDSKQSVSTAPTSPLSRGSSAGDPIHAIQMKERTTVICRYVPDGCNFEEVMEVFSTDSVRPTSAYRDFGNTWYINFATEAQAVASVSATRDRKLRGKAIRAGIKSERTMVTLPQRKGFTAQPTLRTLPESLKDLGIPIPADETLRMPQRHKYSGYPPYDMNAFWPYGVPEMTQQHPYSNTLPLHYPYTYPQQASPVPCSEPRHVRPGYVQHVNNDNNKKHFWKNTNKGGYENRYWKSTIGEPDSKRNIPGQATIQNVEQKAQSRYDTESPLKSHGYFEKERRKDKTDNRRQDNEPNAVKAFCQVTFPPTSRRFVKQKAQSRDHTESPLTSHGSFEKERRKDKTDNRWQGREPNVVNTRRQAHFPALIDNPPTSRIFVKQKAESRDDTESPLISHGSFEKERRKDETDDRQGSEPNAVNVLSQTHFPALIDNVATSRRTQSAPRVDYAAALLNSQNASLPSGESASQTQQLEQPMSKMNISTNAAKLVRLLMCD